MRYCFKVIKTDEIVYHEMKITEYDQFKIDHPELERYFDGAPGLVFDGRTFGTIESKTPQGFKEVLSKIGEAHPLTPLGKKFRRNKTIKEIKTQEAIARHHKRLEKIRKQK